MIKNFLKTSFLEKAESAAEVEECIIKEMKTILSDPMAYSAFNLAVYHITSSQMFYICTETGMNEPLKLKEGINYGLCNGALDDIWPKTEHGLHLFRAVIESMA